jgi:hypothetical protein
MTDKNRLPYMDPKLWERAKGTPGAIRDFSTHDYIPGQAIPTWIKDPDSGLVVVNELKKYVKPFWLTTERVEESEDFGSQIDLAAGEVSDFFPMTIDGKGHFEIFDAFYYSQQPEGFTVELFDPGNLGQERPILMNREVHVATIASGGGVTLPLTGSLPAASSPGRPFRWPQSFFMDVAKGGGTLFARFRNLSASSNTIRFVLSGRRWYHLQAPWKIANRMEEIFREGARTMPYFFTTDGFARIDGGTGLGSPIPFTIRFGDDAYVEWSKAMAASTSPFLIRFYETATKKRLMEQPVLDQLAFGNGEFPMLLWEEALFEPNYQLTCELSCDSEEDNDIWITLGCRKIKVDPRELETIRPGTSPGRPW